jgi:hypothetical protein
MTTQPADRADDPDATLRRWFERDQAIGQAAERRQLELHIVELEARLVDQQRLAHELAGRVDELTVQLARNEQAAAAVGWIQRLLAGSVRRAGSIARRLRRALP